MLVVPALLLASAYFGVTIVVAVLGWFVALATGRVPRGMRDLGAASLRYQAQAYGYVFLLTSRYPDSSPALTPPPEAPPALWLEPAEVV